MITYVTFSDKPVVAKDDNTLALAGNTDAETPLKALLIVMFGEWEKHLKAKERLTQQVTIEPESALNKLKLA